MPSNDRVVIGLGGSNHDGSAALLRASSIEVAIEQERVSRRKHGRAWWWQNPVGQAVEYCLEAAGADLDMVAHFVSSDLLPKRVHEAYPDKEIRLFPHHLCHAASACAMLPTGVRAALLVYDGMGSIVTDPARPGRACRETFSFFDFDAEGLRCRGQTYGEGVVEHDDFPSGCSNSIGKLYDIVTTILGFHEDETGKTMGLAAHGTPRFVPLIESFVTYGDTLSSCFSYDASNIDLPLQLQRILASSGDFSVKADLAASAQAVIENTLLHVSSLIVDERFDVFCVAGGCGLNSVANGRLAQRLPRNTRLLVPPHSGDAGIAFGALWLDRRETTGVNPVFTLRGAPTTPALARPGQIYGEARCRQAAADFYPRLAYDPRVRNARSLAVELARGAVIGVLNGPSEIGPRALGGRSILADPRSATIRERINRNIKLREPFRPLAPMILAERFSEFFEDPRQADPYMLCVARAMPLCYSLAPAVVHIDGTARVQAVGSDADPFLIELLRAFDQLTGVPILLNTSFNRRGEPLVETPADAIDAFLGLRLDGLYLDGLFYVQPNSSAIA